MATIDTQGVLSIASAVSFGAAASVFADARRRGLGRWGGDDSPRLGYLAWAVGTMLFTPLFPV